MHIRTNVPLAPYTTFGIGGPASSFADVRTDEELDAAICYGEEHHLDVCVIGSGSNLLVSDEGYSGLVIRMVSEHVDITEEEASVLVVADAGKSWDELVGECVERGWWGMENLSGIPSSVGASVVQNIGAYGVEVASMVEWVEVYDRATHRSRRITADECRFGYRASVFKEEYGSLWIVLRVAYRLSRSGVLIRGYKDVEQYHESVQPITTLAHMRAAILSVRAAKFPAPGEAGTAGSFFMNPVVTKDTADLFLSRFPQAPVFAQPNGTYKLSAAWIIDHVLHLRGVREGDVGTWPAQALIVVNYGHATATAVMRYVHRIQRAALAEIGVDLTPEVVFVGRVSKEV